MLTIEEAAAHISRSPDALRKAVRSGKLKAIRRAGIYLMDKAEVNRYAEETKRGRPRGKKQDAQEEGGGES